MRPYACLALLLSLAGCASAPPQDLPAGQSQSVDGVAGSPRNRALVHTELAAAYFSRGNMGVALEELRIATSADPTYAPAHNMLGMVYMELKENPLASASFERGLALAPSDPDLNHNYGWFLCSSGREAESVKYFLQAVRNPLYPTPWRSWSAAGLCSLKKNPKDAEDYFQRALRLEPDEPTALLQLAHFRYRQGALEEARRMVTRYNRLLTPSADSLWLGLRIERRLGERTAEQSYANQLRRRYPTSPEYRALLRGQFD